MLNRAFARAIYRDYLADNYVAGDAFEYLLTRRSLFKELYVSKSTDLIVEGYPRSGANYYAALIKSHCKESINVSFRRHTKHQINKGIALKKPIIVLIRNPLDSCISYYISVDKKIGLKYIIKQYTRYYQFISDRRSELTICSFNTLKTDANALLQLASKLTGFSFEPQISESKANDFALNFYNQLAQATSDNQVIIREAPLPTGWKNQEKQKVIEQCLNTDGYREAHQLYESLKNECV